MKRQFCHAKFQKSNQKPIFISQNSIIMETDKCLFALIYIFQKLSGLIYLRNSFRFCVIKRSIHCSLPESTCLPEWSGKQKKGYRKPPWPFTGLWDVQALQEWICSIHPPVRLYLMK